MYFVKKFKETGLRPVPGLDDNQTGYSRFNLVDAGGGLDPHGVGDLSINTARQLDIHLHAYEEAFYIFAGNVVLNVDNRAYLLGPGDYGLIPYGMQHGWQNSGEQNTRWLEMLSPQPKPGNQGLKAIYLREARLTTEAPPPDFRDPRTQYIGHFYEFDLPPVKLETEQTKSNRAVRLSFKRMVERSFGAQQCTMFIAQLAPGAEIKLQDHPYEEMFFFLQGEVELELDGNRYRMGPHDFAWSAVGGVHGFFNNTANPVRWLETQAPQPPAQHGVRYIEPWEQLQQQSGFPSFDPS